MRSHSPLAHALAGLLLIATPSAVRAGDMPSMPGMSGSACPTPDPDSGAEMVGKPAPPWTFTRWVGDPLSQEKLRGKVVLLRWWNVGCHYCEATLPEIESLRARYGKDFVTIAVFHPKPPAPVKDADVRRWAEARGFHGPLAIDQEWSTLSRYWLAGHDERNWTSVSFLIDRDGKIAWVHGGGEYHHSTDPRHVTCDRRATELEAKITELLGKSGQTSAIP
jgi:thiol-disulfide isomerase/thioredoxin